MDRAGLRGYRVTLRIEALTGEACARAIPDLARLRMTVLREWPYLYDGSASYEEDYLADFAAGSDAIIVAAHDGDAIVGAATASPLGEHTADFVPLFVDRGLSPDDIFYCGESVLLPAYRGRGIGHAFFDHREAHARTLNAGGARAFTVSTFCGVIHDPADPRRPRDYRPLDAFWQNRGYARVPGLVGQYAWREIGAAQETRHAMQFWMREL